MFVYTLTRISNFFILLYFYNRLFTFYTTFLLCRFFTRNFFTQTFFYRLGCPIFASYIFSLRSETKRNRNRFASFPLRFVKLTKLFSLLFTSFRFNFFASFRLHFGFKFFASFCFLSPNFFRINFFFFVCVSNLRWF